MPTAMPTMEPIPSPSSSADTNPKLIPSKSTSKTPPTTKSKNGMFLLNLLPTAPRNHFVAMLGEFVGTFLFLFYALAAATVAVRSKKTTTKTDSQILPGESMSMLANEPDAETLMYIALGFGFSLAVNAWVFFRISGGLFNPAVTLGMALVGAIGWLRAGLLFISQMLGAMSAAAVISALYPGPLDVATRLGKETSVVRGLFIEMFLTAGLVFTIFLLAVEKHKATFIAPLGIGLALMIGELAGVFFSGGSLNPARSFCVDVANASFPSYHWIYWVGPGMGALVAVGLYHFVKGLEYEAANPGQDGDGTDECDGVSEKEEGVMSSGGESGVEGKEREERWESAARMEGGEV